MGVENVVGFAACWTGGGVVRGLFLGCVQEVFVADGRCERGGLGNYGRIEKKVDRGMGENRAIGGWTRDGCGWVYVGDVFQLGCGKGHVQLRFRHNGHLPLENWPGGFCFLAVHQFIESSATEIE